MHALGLVAHFDVPDTENHIPSRRLVEALNCRLPGEIRILAAARTGHAFHARFGATTKQYRYQVWNAPVMNPLMIRDSWHVPQVLDETAMQLAAAHFIGRHDFRAFTSRRDGALGESTRTMTRCELLVDGPSITFVLEADGFLYKMCRAVVGTLVRVGRGQMSPSEITELLSQTAGRTRGVNAPAHGLILWKVSYL